MNDSDPYNLTTNMNSATRDLGEKGKSVTQLRSATNAPGTAGETTNVSDSRRTFRHDGTDRAEPGSQSVEAFGGARKLVYNQWANNISHESFETTREKRPDTMFTTASRGAQVMMQKLD